MGLAGLSEGVARLVRGFAGPVSGVAVAGSCWAGKAYRRQSQVPPSKGSPLFLLRPCLPERGWTCRYRGPKWVTLRRPNQRPARNHMPARGTDTDINNDKMTMPHTTLTQTLTHRHTCTRTHIHTRMHTRIHKTSHAPAVLPLLRFLPVLIPLRLYGHRAANGRRPLLACVSGPASLGVDVCPPVELHAADGQRDDLCPAGQQPLDKLESILRSSRGQQRPGKSGGGDGSAVSVLRKSERAVGGIAHPRQR